MMFNRQTRRKFNKLPNEEKQKAIEIAVTEGVNKALAKHIPLAFTRGVKYEDNALYEKYVERIDSARASDREAEIEKLLSHLRTAHLTFIKDFPDKKEEEGPAE